MESFQQMETLPIGPCAGSCGTAAYRGSPVIACDIATDPLWDVPEHRASALKHGLQASWSSPVLSSKGKVLGTFCMYYRQPRIPSSQDLELIELATHLVRVAIERDRAEEALRRSEAYLAEAQPLTQTGSWAWNRVTGKGLYWSEEMFRIFGLDPQEGIPTYETFCQRVHLDDQNTLYERIQRSISHKSDYVNDPRIVLPDGTVKHIQTIGHPVFDGTGEIVEYVGTAMDVTERKRADEERERLHQLEADLAHMNRVGIMGGLAASLAHEIKQPITAAATNARACLRWLQCDQPDFEEVREASSRMLKDATRAIEIIKRTSSLYKKGTSQRELVDINEVIEEMIVLLRNEGKGSGVSIRSELASNLPRVKGDRVQLQQVLMNLVLNSVDAMKNVSGRRELTLSSQLDGNSQLLVSVSDTGTGLPPEMEQIFDAFFTTKPHGTGMGLAISRTIIESHGGRLWATSNSGGGAIFYFTVPVEAQR